MKEFIFSSPKSNKIRSVFQTMTGRRNFTFLLLSSCLWNQNICAVDHFGVEEDSSSLKCTCTPFPSPEIPSLDIFDECKKFLRGNGTWHLTEQGVLFIGQGDLYINRLLFNKNLSIFTDGTVYFDGDVNLGGNTAIKASRILMRGNIRTKGLVSLSGNDLTIEKQFSAEKGAKFSVDMLLNKGILSVYGGGLSGMIKSFVNDGKVDLSHAKINTTSFDNRESSILRTRGHFLLQGDLFKNHGSIFTAGVHQLELKNAYEDRGNLFAPTLFLLNAPRIEYFSRHNSWLREGVIAASLYLNISKDSNFALYSSEDKCFLQLSSQGDLNYGGAITQRSTSFPFGLYDEIWSCPANQLLSRQISSTRNHPLANEVFSLSFWNQFRNHWESGVVFHTEGDSIDLNGSVDLTAGTVRKSVKGKFQSDGTHLKAGCFTGDDIQIESKNAFLKHSEFSALSGKISALVDENAHFQNMQMFGKEVALVGAAQLQVNNSEIESKKDISLRGGQVGMVESSAKSQESTFLAAERQLNVDNSQLTSQGNHFSGEDINAKRLKMSGASTMDAGRDLVLDDTKASSHLSTRSGNKTSFVGQNEFNGVNAQAKHIENRGKIHDLGATQFVAERVDQRSEIASDSVFIQADDYVDSETSKAKAVSTLVLVNEKGTGIAGTLEADTVVIKMDDFQLKGLKRVIAKITQLHINKDVVVDEDLLLNNTLHLWANSLIQRQKVTVMGDLVAQLKEEVALYDIMDIRGRGAIIAEGALKVDRGELTAEKLYLQSKKKDVTLFNAALKAFTDIKISADEGNIKKTASLLQAGENVGLKAGLNIESRSVVERVGTGNNFSDNKVTDKIQAGGNLTEEAGGHIVFSGVENKAGGDISYNAGGHIVDMALALETQHSHGDDKNFDKSHRVVQSVSTHQAGGDFVSSAEGNQELYAPEISAVRIKIAGKKRVNVVDVHDTEVRQSQSESEGGFFGQDRKKQESSQSAHSKGAKFYGIKRLEITAGEGISLTNITSTAPENSLKSIAGAVQILLGKTQTSSSSHEKSSNILWDRQTSHVEEHKTYSASTFSGSLEISSKETLVESIKGQSLDFTKQLEAQGINVTNSYLEEYHKNDTKTVQGPSKALAAVVVLAVSICTAGTGAAIGGAVASGMAATGTVATVITGMTAAAFTSVCSQAALALLANEGNIVKAAESLASTKTLENLGIAMLTAGVTAGVTDALHIPQSSAQATTLQQIERQAVQSTVGLTANLATGQNLEQALLQAARSTAAGVVSGVASRSIGEAYTKHDVDFIGHKFLHALVGGATGALLSDDPLKGAVSGAVGAVTAEMIGELVLMNTHKTAGKIIDKLAEDNTLITPEAIQHAVNEELTSNTNFIKLLTSGIALLTGQDVSIANFTACSALDNNFSKMASTIIEQDAYSILETQGITVVHTPDFMVPIEAQSKSSVPNESNVNQAARVAKDVQEVGEHLLEVLDHPEIGQEELKKLGSREEFVAHQLSRLEEKAHREGMGWNEEQRNKAIACAKFTYAMVEVFAHGRHGSDKVVRDVTLEYESLKKDFMAPIHDFFDPITQKIDEFLSAIISEGYQKLGIERDLADWHGQRTAKAVESQILHKATSAIKSSVIPDLSPSGHTKTHIDKQGDQSHTTPKPRDLHPTRRSDTTMADDKTFQGAKNLEVLERGRVVHKGFEVRAVRDTSHITTEHLERMRKDGVAPYDVNGDKLVLHHNGQQDHRQEGNFLVQVPERYHDVQNPRQHPNGNESGKGLPKDARQEFPKDAKSFNRALGKASLENRKKQEQSKLNDDEL